MTLKDKQNTNKVSHAGTNNKDENNTTLEKYKQTIFLLPFALTQHIMICREKTIQNSSITVVVTAVHHVKRQCKYDH